MLNIPCNIKWCTIKLVFCTIWEVRWTNPLLWALLHYVTEGNAGKCLLKMQHAKVHDFYDPSEHAVNCMLSGKLGGKVACSFHISYSISEIVFVFKSEHLWYKSSNPCPCNIEVLRNLVPAMASASCIPPLMPPCCEKLSYCMGMGSCYWSQQ